MMKPARLDATVTATRSGASHPAYPATFTPIRDKVDVFARLVQRRDRARSRPEHLLLTPLTDRHRDLPKFVGHTGEVGATTEASR